MEEENHRISYSKSDVRITLSKNAWSSGLSAAIFGALATKEVNVDMIVQNISSDGKFIDITFTTSKEELERAKSPSKLEDEIKYSDLKLTTTSPKFQLLALAWSATLALPTQCLKPLLIKD